MTMAAPTTKLDHCVRTLKSLTRNLSSKTPAQVADLYVAAVGLLCHLKADQATLQASWEQNSSASCPSPKKTPAITAVLQDPALFDALVGCLKAAGGGMGSGSDGDRLDVTGSSTTNSNINSRVHPSSGHHGGMHAHHNSAVGNSNLLNNRKRSNSVASDDIHASKAIKLSHSPVPTTSRMYHHRTSYPAAADAGGGGEYSPTVNVQVVAATILFLTFSHLDHWPAALVKAYAEDCFGARLWVDDERCKVLVENLQLMHETSSSSTLSSTSSNANNTNGDDPPPPVDAEMKDTVLLEDALKVADSYSRLMEFIAEDQAETDNASPSQQPRRGSLSSVGSSGPTSSQGVQKSNSRDETDSAGGGNGSRAGKKQRKSSKTKKKSAKDKKRSSDDDGGGGSSSSSGEEDEEVLVTTTSAGDEAGPSPKKKSKSKRGSPVSPKADSEMGDAESSSIVEPSKRQLYPLTQRKLNLTRVRQRFFGANLQNAHDAISSSLSERLDAKAKQNSALLQSLRSFTGIPEVRSLVAGNLERWLQSPGLSGLARTLFTATVTQIENVDPPRPADLEAIQKVLAMRLKANQLSAHIENVTTIASTAPSSVVSRQMYHQLLSEVLVTMERGADGAASDHLKMVGAIYSVFPKNLSADGIAASLLMIMGNSRVSNSSQRTKTERKQLAKHLKHLLQLLAQQLGASFDVCKLIESFLSYNVKDESWTVDDEEDRARLMYQCVLLLIPPLPKESIRHPVKSSRKGVALTDIEAEALKKKLSTARQLFLSWFCADYGPLFQTTNVASDISVGAGFPDYRSALGGLSGGTAYPRWLNIARCLLFMENADSRQMQRFVRGTDIIDETDASWYDERNRIDRCHEYGCDFDDEMMWIILKSASSEDGGGLSSEIALTLLEHLFECCGVHRRGSLNITDMMLAWELYSLAVYQPPEAVIMEHEVMGTGKDPPGVTLDDADEESGIDHTKSGMVVATADLDLPQLAYPAMWWRATILALVLCGVAPQQIGATIWEEHPTLRAMIKMVISSRYRFPTVDCDETDRLEMKKDEQVMREEEAKIAETLFLPPRSAKRREPETDTSYGRSRISARQQQKRERAERKKREKEAAEALLEENKRKKKLRALTKTICLWDPTSSPRKPPREAAELLVSVESHFDLSRIFQRSVEPDFLLMTIGKTTRGAIERAYDWLIPIISTMPETIARLHASASCVLLLRAYGTEGDERAQLKQLSAPLLKHVNDSLTGRFGQADAVRAFDLLMSDVASPNPDRRRCARRVLFDSIGKFNSSGSGGGQQRSSWMLNILKLDHAKWLVGDAIKHMSTAIAFERGDVLRNLLLALGDLIAFAKKNEIEGDWNFASVFIVLISSRPSVCAEALDRFADIRTLGIKTVYEAFEKCIKDSSILDRENGVSITLGDRDGDKQAILSLPLLQAASVLLSIWKEPNGAAAREGCSADAGDYKGEEAEATKFITSLTDMLLHPIESRENQKGPAGMDRIEIGLASAKMMQSGTSAVSVESWIMLAKARSDTIARRAALTAPTAFLPRLLFCSGLPKASLLTMIDRLGNLGDESNEKDVVFNRLLVPSATSEWDIGRLGQRREVARKLLGRLSAYLRMNKVSLQDNTPGISTSFLYWLSEECSKIDKPKKKQKPKSKSAAKGTPTVTTSVLQSLCGPDHVQVTDFSSLEADNVEMDSFRPWGGNDVCKSDNSYVAAKDNIRKAIEENQPNLLELVFRQQLGVATSTGDVKSPTTPQHVSLAILALQSFIGAQQLQDAVKRIVLDYVPKLSSLSGSPELWRLVFSSQESEIDQVLDTLLCRCLAAWHVEHISSCCDWLLSTSKTFGTAEYSVARVTRFMVLTSGQLSVHLEKFSTKVTIRCIESWGKSEEFVAASTAIAIEGMKQTATDGFRDGLLSRNCLPDWLILVLALAKCGRIQMKYICEAILQRISQPTEHLGLPLLRAVFLRLYVCNPHGMNLGTAMIRGVLMEAAEEYSISWLDWRSPLDDQLQDMLDTVMSGSGQRLVRPLSDLSKKHPLLVLRKSHLMTKFLEKDAEVGAQGAKDPRGVVHAQSSGGMLHADISGKLVKVSLKHWGYSYSEKIWIALLEILSAVPGPVLFGCGLGMGFTDFLNVNMRLLFVQSQLRKTERDSSRLKDKLKELLGTFRKSSRSGWEKWLASTDHGLPSLGEMKNVLICCDCIDPKDVL